MKKLFATILLSGFALQAAPQMQQPLFDSEQNLVINNRVLLKVGGKPITVMDVVKKMDLIFYRQFPEMASSDMARYQFYSSAWESMLAAVIDDHLIVADAEEKQVQVTEGEVREELERLFGPDVVMNLDKLGMSLSEALDLLRMELTVQRMNMAMVRSKAVVEVHPKQVRARYEEMVKANPPQDKWVYKILSVRGEGHEQVASEASKLLSEQNMPFEEVIASLSSEDVELSVSDYERADQDLSLAYKAVLQTLGAGAYSAPMSKESVSRIFCLKQFESGAPDPFNSVADQLKGELTQEVAVKLGEAYRKKLRDHYGITESYLSEVVPDTFAPFAMR